MILLLLAFVSCASTSRMIEETKDGGKVMILGSKGIGIDAGIEDAKTKMSQKCPKGYEVIKKGWMSTSSINPNQAMTEEMFYEFKCK